MKSENLLAEIWLLEELVKDCGIVKYKKKSKMLSMYPLKDVKRKQSRIFFFFLSRTCPY